MLLFIAYVVESDDIVVVCAIDTLSSSAHGSSPNVKSREQFGVFQELLHDFHGTSDAMALIMKYTAQDMMVL